jgi:hypothetical protein
MKRLLVFVVVLSISMGLTPVLARADDPLRIAPLLADETLRDDASSELGALVASLEEEHALALRGIYVAFELSRIDVAAFPACDDDGDYVVVVSQGLLELIAHVAFADASDRLRGTHLLPEYGLLLARSQRLDIPPLPPPVTDARVAVNTERVARAFVADALAWVVADEVAHASLGHFACPSPTATHEADDDVWTEREHLEGLTLAPGRMTDLEAADLWAARALRSSGRSLVPAIELFRAMAPLEQARPAGRASNYLTLHPHAAERAALLERTEVAPCARACLQSPSDVGASRAATRQARPSRVMGAPPPGPRRRSGDSPTSAPPQLRAG